MKLYLVLHHEVMGVEEYRDDEMVFHLAASLDDAIKYIKTSHVEEWSWWEIQEAVVGDMEWPQSLGFFGRRGGKLKAKPWDRAVAAYEKAGGAFRM